MYVKGGQIRAGVRWNALARDHVCSGMHTDMYRHMHGYLFVHQVAERKRLHNLVLELKGNIRVFCRVRPQLKHETGEGCEKSILFPEDGRCACAFASFRAYLLNLCVCVYV